jgi:hypothetical protein
MVKVAGPAFSLDASGALGDAIVYSKWKGRPYVRERVIPSNPRSAGQVAMRAMLTWLAQQWDAQSAADKLTWDDPADAEVISAFNAFTKNGLGRWRNFTPPGTAYPVPGTGTEASINDWTVTGGVRSITFDQTITTVNDNWGTLLFRSTTSSFTTAWNNLIAVILADDLVAHHFVDSPLDPATYYYNCRNFTYDGLLGVQQTEQNAVAS